MKSIKTHPPKAGTKLANLVSALSGRGVTLSKLSDKLGWQPHTVRAAMTGLRKRGYVIVRTRSEKTRLNTYKISKPSS